MTPKEHNVLERVRKLVERELPDYHVAVIVENGSGDIKVATNYNQKAFVRLLREVLAEAAKTTPFPLTSTPSTETRQ